jgi:type IV pilus assembly protein PilB
MDFLNELVRLGLIKDSQAAEVMRRANEKYGGNLDQALAEFGVTDAALLQARSAFFNIPSKQVNPHIPFEILKYVPEDSAKNYGFVPIGLVDGVLEVGVTDPNNIGAIDALQFITSRLNMPFKLYLISRKTFEGVLDNYKGISGEVGTAMSELDSELGSEIDNVDTSGVLIETPQKDPNAKPGEEEKIVEDAPIIKIVAVILRHATEGDASDIHIENTGDKVKVRFRVDGTLHTSLILPLGVYAGIIARIKILSKLRLDEKRKPQDGGFSTTIDGRKIDFRVSTFPAYYGEKIVMRILDSDKGVKPITGLDLSPENLALVREAITRPYGIILITGPTGSGKSTTLYSMLNELDREKANVVSLEDPVEYHMPDVNQSQVMPEIGYTFASGLRSILRQDPDIIMVGEIRDKETAQLAIQAALTGHLVLSTLHTNTAIGAIPRLVDMGVDPYLIAPTLILSMAQRLVRIACPNAISEIPMDQSTKEYIDNEFKDLPEEYQAKLPVGDKMYQVGTAPDCPSGTKGRVGVFEMFKVDPEIQKLILDKPNEQDLYKHLRDKKGFITMREDAILKALRGEIPFQDVYTL